MQDDSKIKSYLHDDFAGKKRPSRQFLIDIIGTVYPGFFKEVIEGQTSARFERQASEEVGEHILATDEWAEALAEHPFESSKYSCPLPLTPFLYREARQVPVLPEGEGQAHEAEG